MSPQTEKEEKEGIVNRIHDRYGDGCDSVCVRECVRACVRACGRARARVRACACVYVRACACVRASMCPRVGLGATVVVSLRGARGRLSGEGQYPVVLPYSAGALRGSPTE